MRSMGFAELAAELGADVPSQLDPAFALVGGAGEAVEPLAPPRHFGVVLIAADGGLSTAEVYAEADRLGLGRDPDELDSIVAELREAAGRGASPLEYRELLVNDLAHAALSLRPDDRRGARRARGRGSGGGAGDGVWADRLRDLRGHRRGRRRGGAAGTALRRGDRGGAGSGAMKAGGESNRRERVIQVAVVLLIVGGPDRVQPARARHQPAEHAERPCEKGREVDLPPRRASRRSSRRRHSSGSCSPGRRS